MKCEQISLKIRSGIFKSSAETNEVNYKKMNRNHLQLNLCNFKNLRQ